jgi:hypothetical protein
MTLPYFTWPLGSTPDPDPPSVRYVVRVRLVDLASWIATNDPDFEPVYLPDEDEIGLLADPLTITRSLPQSDLFPLQPDPATATFAVVTPTAADLDTLALGSPVAITYWSPYIAFTPPTEAFYGRVADVQVTPGEYLVGHDEAGDPIIWNALHQVTCVDYLADIAEDQITWGQDYLSLGGDNMLTEDLVAEVWDQLGMGDLVYEEYDGETPWNTGPYVGVPNNTTDTGGAAFLEQLLAQWALDDDLTTPARYVLDQNIDAFTGLPDADQPYILRVAGKNLPATADDYLDPPDPDNLTVVDADHVDLGATTYTLRKYDGVTRVIAYPAEDSDLPRMDAEHGSSPHVTIKFASTIVQGPALIGAAIGHLARIATLYLPADVARNRYAADAFTWRLHAAPEGSFLPALGAPVAVDGIDAAWTPSGLTWFTGRLTGYTLTIATKRPVLEFTLRDVAS